VSTARRGVAALGNVGISTTAVMVFVAAVTDLLLPTLAYLGIALDGSKISRERDSLAAELDDDLDTYLESISDSRRDLARVSEIGDTLKTRRSRMSATPPRRQSTPSMGSTAPSAFLSAACRPSPSPRQPR
jgi:hypothetical protein